MHQQLRRRLSGMGDIIDRCPECGELPTIGKNAISGKPMVACMNICCRNMKYFEDDNVGKAMAEWNNWCKSRIATRVTTKVKEKPKYKKCRECRWLDQDTKTSIGCLCCNPQKNFRYSTSKWKYPSARACKLFEERKGVTEC